MEPEKERLVMDHLHLVEVIASDKEFRGRAPRDDLIAEGNLALVSAANRWVNNGSAKFSTYATTRVRGALQDYLRKEKGRGFTHLPGDLPDNFLISLDDVDGEI